MILKCFQKPFQNYSYNLFNHGFQIDINMIYGSYFYYYIVKNNHIFHYGNVHKWSLIETSTTKIQKI